MSMCRDCLLLLIALAPTSFGQTIKAANVTFTTFDVPGATITNGLGINNNGDIVGNYADGSSAPSHGFLYSVGAFTSLDYPSGSSTLANGINDAGQIIGYAYLKQGTAAAGFLYEAGAFTTIRTPGMIYTLSLGINGNGYIVGGDGSFGGNQGFELIRGQFKNITPPGTHTLVYATGINNSNEIVGYTSVGVGDCNGFVYKGGTFQTILFPGASITEALGINDSAVVVGWYSSGSFTGFAMLHGKYLSIKYPGSIYTFASGINNSGQVVGTYTTDQQTYHAFVTSPILASDF